MAELFTVVEAYDKIERGDFVHLQHADGTKVDVLVDGVLWLQGQHKPLHIVSSRGRRYALGADDRIVRKERARGY